MSLSSLNRRHTFLQFKEKTYDLLVIGGGITGAGIALDAASRGMSVALVDKSDFAAGTSSRSTKLVHGGLRYLKNFQFKVVADTGKERSIVHQNGPHVTHREPMLLPIHKGGGLGRFTTSLGLRFYDYLAGVKEDERRAMLKAGDVLAKVPNLKKEGLKGGGYYVEYRTDDARLTIEVIKKAHELGADVINYAEVKAFNYDDSGMVEGAVIIDKATNNTYLIDARVVVNATGPWVENLERIINPKNDSTKDQQNERLLLTKGVHIVFDKARFPLEQSIYFDTEYDKRMIFAIPRGNKVYVGTTDTIYVAEKENPPITTMDRYYLLGAINYMFPTLGLTEVDIESSWAGLRPLIKEDGKDPSAISRKDEIWEDHTGVMTIAGGKLTGYRLMAEEIVDRVAEKLKIGFEREFNPCQTLTLPISGGDIAIDQYEAFIEAKGKEAIDFNLTEEAGRRLAAFYGTNVDKLFTLAKNATPDKMGSLPIELYVRLLYGLEEEAIMTPADFFIRRTGALYFDIDAVYAYKDDLLKVMARYFGWSLERIAYYNAEMASAIYHATHAVEEEGVIKIGMTGMEGAQKPETLKALEADVEAHFKARQARLSHQAKEAKKALHHQETPKNPQEEEPAMDEE